MKRLLQVLNWLVTAALVLVIGIAVTLAISARRSQDAIPTVLGHKVLTVLSGSMEPVIHTGDVIVVKPVAPGEEIKDGDIITYHASERADMLITHRVVGVLQVNGETRGFATKGDANKDPDSSLVAMEQVVGLYQWRVPYFGYVSTFLRKPAGIALFVILPGVTLIGLEFRKMWLALTEAEAKAKEEAAAEVEGGESKAE